MNAMLARAIVRDLSEGPECDECGEYLGMTGAIVFLLANGAISEADLVRALEARMTMEDEV